MYYSHRCSILQTWTVHFLRHGRIILFPECDCPKIQHAAPVGTDLVQNFCQFSHLAQYIQLKEVKVWCCDCRNFIIFEYVFEYFFLLLFVCDIKQNCKNIRMSCHITFTRSEGYGNREFLELVYPKMVSLMEFCNGRREEHGFLIGKEKDWVYIDWADMDKDGPLCAEQMLYAACFRVMAEISEQLGKDGSAYRQDYEKLTAQHGHFPVSLSGCQL